DLDIGGTGTNPTNMWSASTSSPAHATIFNFASTPTKGWSDEVGNFGINTRDTIVDQTTSELQIGTLRLVALNQANLTNMNFLPRPTTDAGSALWFEDGIATGRTPGTGVYLLGGPP